MRHLLVLLILLTGCAKQPLQLPDNGEFEGVRTALERRDCVNIVMIHGMGGYSPADPHTLKSSIIQSLHLSKSSPDCTREVVGEVSGKPFYYGNLKREEYRDPCSSKIVRFYVIQWHQTVDVQKQRLMLMDRKSSAFCQDSIQEIKNTLINQASADTILYFSSYRSEMQHPIIQSIRWIVEDSKSQTSNENLVVGYSMGGNLIVNSLITMRFEESDNSAIAKTFIKDTSAVYFLSNGYPLAELFEDHPEKHYNYDDKQACELAASTNNAQVDTWNWKKSPIGLFVHEKRETSPDFQIVSFYDPNDIFGYNATEYPVPSNNGHLNAFLNERVRNVKPTAFGFLDPRDAHTGYGKNPQVICLIINGLHAHKIKNPCCL